MITAFYFFLVFYLILLLYYWFGWRRTEEHNISSNTSTSITVIISARNEEQNVSDCLQNILRQDYPSSKFNIIVVDDYSTDNTSLEVSSMRSDKITLLSLKDTPGKHSAETPNKKIAITEAVKRADGELIVVTDADCNMTDKWLAGIASFYDQYNPGFIAGPVLLEGSNSFLSQFQKLDMLSMTGITASAISNNNPTLSNAANMAFERDLFLKIGGFGIHCDKPSGDDIFLMHKFQQESGKPVLYLKNRLATVISNTEETLTGFIEQRKRWVSKSTTYSKKSVTITLLLAYLFNLSILLSFFLAAFGKPEFLLYATLSLSAKLIIDFIFLYPVSRFFKRSHLLFLFLPIQIFHVIYVVVIGILGMLFDYDWKGRTVHKQIWIRPGKVEQ